MEQKFRPNDMSLKIMLLCAMAGACIGLFALGLDAILPPAVQLSTPEFTFHNAGPCLGPGQNLMKGFVEGEPQYICADMVTNESTVNLELHVFKSENKDQVYVDGETFASGPISFAISPPLPPGKYWAKITWSRPALTDFEFEVIRKNTK